MTKTFGDPSHQTSNLNDDKRTDVKLLMMIGSSIRGMLLILFSPSFHNDSVDVVSFLCSTRKLSDFAFHSILPCVCR